MAERENKNLKGMKNRSRSEEPIYIEDDSEYESSESSSIETI